MMRELLRFVRLRPLVSAARGGGWIGLVTPALQASNTGPAILAVSNGPQRQFRYCCWYRSSRGAELDILKQRAGHQVEHVYR